MGISRSKRAVLDHLLFCRMTDTTLWISDLTMWTLDDCMAQ